MTSTTATSNSPSLSTFRLCRRWHLGRHLLATRLTANLRLCAISYSTIFTNGRCRTHKPEVPNMADEAHSLSCKAAEAMVDIYTNTRSKFTVDDHDHYLFNSRDLTFWVSQLLRYDIVSVDTFLNAWAYETNRIFRDRLVWCQVSGPV